MNGGRLPLGVNATSDPGAVTLHTSTRNTATLWLDAVTGLPLDAAVDTATRSVADLSAVSLPLGSDEPTTVAATDAGRAAQATLASAEAREAERADEADTWLTISLAIAVLSLLALAVLVLIGRAAPKPHGRPPTHEPAPPRGPGGDLHATPLPR